MAYHCLICGGCFNTYEDVIKAHSFRPPFDVNMTPYVIEVIEDEYDSIEQQIEDIRESVVNLMDDLSGTGAESVLSKVYELLGKALEELEE